MPTIVPVYAGLLGILFFWLSLRVSLTRLKGPASTDEARENLRLAIRAQGNAAEYIPLGLILLLVLEFQSTPGWLLHLFGLLLLAGRVGHFIGFDLAPHRLLRQFSMVLTYAMFCFSSLAILYFAVTG
ncbi:MAG: putative membrane protein YecN with MAPEG domain [Paracoccaceae bacterium]|jgi:uncharacterized membrane protein YecN with MAPEG domain